MNADLLAQPGLLLGAVLVFALAGVVKGVVGLGLPTVSMALLALFMPTGQAAAWLLLQRHQGEYRLNAACRTQQMAGGGFR